LLGDAAQADTPQGTITSSRPYTILEPELLADLPQTHLIGPLFVDGDGSFLSPENYVIVDTSTQLGLGSSLKQVKWQKEYTIERGETRPILVTQAGTWSGDPAWINLSMEFASGGLQADDVKFGVARIWTHDFSLWHNPSVVKEQRYVRDENNLFPSVVEVSLRDDGLPASEWRAGVGFLIEPIGESGYQNSFDVVGVAWGAGEVVNPETGGTTITIISRAGHQTAFRVIDNVSWTGDFSNDWSSSANWMSLPVADSRSWVITATGSQGSDPVIDGGDVNTHIYGLIVGDGRNLVIDHTTLELEGYGEIHEGGTVELQEGQLLLPETSALSISQSGALVGTGLLRGRVENSGKVGPGGRGMLGVLNMTRFSHSFFGVLEMDLGNSGGDKVVVDGEVVLNGIVELTFLNQPQIGETWRIVDAGSVNQNIKNARASGYDIDETRAAALVYNANSVDVVVTYAGDANLDSRVDENDLDVISSHYGALHHESASYASGDFDYNHRVDEEDLRILGRNWGLGSEGEPPPFADALRHRNLPIPPEFKVAATVILGGLEHTYDGGGKMATANSISPAGLSVVLTYDSSPNPPVEAGSYPVLATINDSYYTGSANGTMVINKATAEVTLSDLEWSYDGTAKLASASTNPSGLNVSLTYEGGVAAPVNAGSYAVFGVVNDANYTGSAVGAMVINKSVASVTLSGLEQKYDGSAKTASVSTNPSGLRVDLTYDGITNAPVNTGSYMVAANVNDANYSGGASGTLTIEKGIQTISFNTLAARDVNSAPFALNATASSGLPVSYISSNTDVAVVNGNIVTIVGTGSAVITASQSGDVNYFPASASQTLWVACCDGGAVVVWGDNTYGQSDVPTGLSGITAIEAGYRHTVVLKSDGTVAAWGNNAFGQTNVPDGLKGVRAIAAGGRHTVILKDDGSVMAWGGAGQTNVPGDLSGVIAVAAGLSHTMALRSDGAVVAWGDNDEGQSAVPAGLVGVTAVAAGSGHSVALKSDGTVVAWGRNDFGQATVPVGLSGVAAIAAGSWHTVALKNDGNVVAWGRASSASAVPAGLSGVTAVSAGVFYTVALKSDGTVVAWGENVYGELRVPAGLNGVTAISGGVYHTAALIMPARRIKLSGLNHTYDGSAKVATASTVPEGLNVSFTYDGSAIAPVNPGSYAVVAEIDDTIYEGSITGTLVIEKAAQTISFPAIPDQIATSTVELSAMGGDSGNPVTFEVTAGPGSIRNGVLSFAGAGSVNVTASQIGNANYEAAPDVSRAFNVTKAGATVTLGSLAQIYDGTPKAATATTSPVGKAVVFTYVGGTSAPVNAGSYEVVGTIDDPVYEGNATGTLVVAKASQTVTFSPISDQLTTATVNLTATGGGSGNPVTFAVTGGPGTISNGLLSFTGAGSVTVTASQAGNGNYEAAPDVPRTFTVTKAVASVTLGSLSQTYDGTPKSATATTNPAGKTVVFTYDGSGSAPVNVGSYEVVGMIDDPIYEGSATGTLVVTKAAQAINFPAIPDQLTTDMVNLSATGGGSGNPVTFAVTAGPATISNGVLSFSGAGSVTITANQAGGPNHESAPEVSRTFTVTKAMATVNLGNLSQTYDGTPKAATATTDPAGKAVTYTYEGSSTAPTDAGTYEVIGTVDDPIYQGSATGTLVIAKASQSIAFAAIPDRLTTDTVNLSATGGASGNPVTFAVTSGPATLTGGNQLTFTGAGEVTITASQAGNGNYEAAPDVPRTFTVTKAMATVSLGSLSQTYDGTPKSATATTDPTGKTVVFTYDGSSTAPTNAGSFEVLGAIDDPIYQGSATGTLVIGKAAQTLVFAAIPDQLATDTVNLTATGGGSGNPVTFAVTSGSASIDGNNVLSFTGDGEVTITASQAGNSNHHDAIPVARTFTVTKASATVTLINLAQTYDGTPKLVGATTNPPGKTVGFTYDGSATAPINAGSYSVVGTITDSIYQGSASGTLVVAKASQTVTFAAIPGQLTTATVNLSATGGGSGNPVTFAVTAGPATISNGVMSFTGAGSVTVTASQAGNGNYEAAPDVPRTFTVTKAMATVTLGSLSQTYDGTPRPVTATTDPAGKSVVFTYDGSSTAPTNAGSYEVIGTINDPIYQGNATGTFVIGKAAQAILFDNPGPREANTTVTLSATGGGSGNPVTFSAVGPAQIDGSNVLSFTGPGSVTVRANQAGNANYEAAPEVSHNFTVTAASATLTLSRLHQVADGTAREVVVTTNPADLEIEVTYDGDPEAPTAPGSYAVVASSADARYEGSASGTLVVDDSARSFVVPGGSLPALSALGELLVPTFRIGAYEVTGSQWAAVVAWAEANAGYDFGGAGSAASGDRPVTGVSWYDAAKWCNARTEWENALLGRFLAPAYRITGTVYMTGIPTSPGDLTCDFGVGGYRLPTAAEWEYAARGGVSGTPSPYPGGDTLDDLGWFAGNSEGSVQPAGGRTANGLDLYDLAGNAAEWTWDAPAGAPGQRLLRGGAWSSAASACELSSLSGETPALRLDRSGFRLANSVSLALAVALDHPEHTWESGGSEPWFAQTGTTHDGTDAAEIGPLAQGQSSWAETTVEGPGNLRFRWKTAGSEGQDVLAFAVDSTPVQSRSGTGDWEERLVEIGSGSHTVRWTYTRGSVAGEARAWLDTVQFETASPPSVTTAPVTDLTGTAATIGGEVTDDGGREVTVRGVVYATSPDPVLGSAIDLPAVTGGLGNFSVSTASLNEGATYYARAYATNNLGTSYGDPIVFTTRTNLDLTGGSAEIHRDILPGDRHVFDFSLSEGRFVTFTATGDAPLRAELRNAAGEVIAEFTGDANFVLTELLEAGGYSLEIFRSAGSGAALPYALAIDASILATVRPDVAVGASASGLLGRDVYLPTGQAVSLISRRVRPVTGYLEIANRGTRTDRIRIASGGGNALFAVAYFGASGNVTAACLQGTYETPAMDAAGTPDNLRVVITPNKKKLVKKIRGRTKILKKSITLTSRATSVHDPTLQDAAAVRAQTK